MSDIFKIKEDLVNDIKTDILSGMEEGETIYYLDSIIENEIKKTLDKFTLDEKLNIIIKTGEENIDKKYVDTVVFDCLNAMVSADDDIQVLQHYSDDNLAVDDKPFMEMIMGIVGDKRYNTKR